VQTVNFRFQRFGAHAALAKPIGNVVPSDRQSQQQMLGRQRQGLWIFVQSCLGCTDRSLDVGRELVWSIRGYVASRQLGPASPNRRCIDTVEC
jgi:hypothetical protein